MAKLKKSVEEKITLSVTPRTVFGKQLKKIREQGLVPANIFGTDYKSKAISINIKDFLKTYKKAKETAVVYLQLDKEEIPTLIKGIQRHPVYDSLLHIDLRKIDLKKEIETLVPVKTVGVSEAVAQKGGVLLTQSDNLNIKALPEKIPSYIEIDISKIKEIGQEIKVSDLAKSGDYAITEDANKVIVSVIAHKEESIAPETTAAAPEVITEKTEEVTGTEAATEPIKNAPPAEKASPKQPEKK
ncbi:50S ribosomal protein L25 [Candidatus Roizmanbacteria bacterium]|nr:50S ribosomal protein L25 [Candidatus Roizmanbacteria bacterium]